MPAPRPVPAAAATVALAAVGGWVVARLAVAFVPGWLPWVVAGVAAVAAGAGAAYLGGVRRRADRADRAAATWTADLAWAQGQIETGRNRLHQQLDALGDLTRDGLLDNPDPLAALRHLTEVVARTLEVDRVSVWELHPDGSALRCTTLFERPDGRHSAGVELRAADAPTFFAALGFVRVIAAGDAAADPQTRELAAAHLRPEGIGAVLAAPVVLAAGRVHGVVWCGHVGPPREWLADEQTFAVAAANLAALVFQGASRRRAEDEVRRSEERYRALVENAFDGVTGYDETGRIVYVSPNNARLDGRDPAATIGVDGIALLHPAERDRGRAVLAEVLAHPDRRVQTRSRFLHADGSVRWGEGVLRNLLANPAVRAIVLNWRDVTDQLAAEAAVRASEAKTRAIIQAVPDALFLLGPDGRFTEVHAPDPDRLYRPPAEFLGRTVAEVIPDPPAAALAARFAGVLATRAPAELDYDLPTAAGEPRHLHARFVPADPDGVLVVVQDVTARRRAELALQRANEELEARVRERTAALEAANARLREAQTIAGIGGYSWDVTADALTCSDELLRLLGRTAADGPTAFAAYLGLVHPDYREKVRAKLGAALESGRDCSHEYQVVRPDGEVRWVHGRGRVVRGPGGAVRVEGTLQDVTERKAADEALRASEALNRAIIDAEPECVKVIGPGCRLESMNPAGLRMVDADRVEQVVGRHVPSLLPPEYRDAYQAAVAEAFAGRQSVVEFELVGLKGTRRRMEQTAAPIPDPDDPARASRVIAVSRDVTERAATEAALRASLAEKEALLKEVHHRVKNNLQIVMSLLNLRADGLTDPAVLAPLRESRDRVASMALIHETLYRSGDLARLDPAGYVEALCAQLVRSYAADPGRVRLALRVEPVALDLDRAIPVGLLLNELVSNALKHAFPGDRAGTITVTLAAGPGGTATLAVADDGVGFPPGADPYRGDTLGLQLVPMLARQLDGTFTVESNGGVRVAVTFRA